MCLFIHFDAQIFIWVSFNWPTVSIVKLVFFHRQSYDVEISVDIPGSTSKSTNILDLKNPYFRYGGQVVAPPPQGSTTSPTEQYYQTNGYQTNTVNLKVNNNQSQEHQQVQNLANFTSVSISGGGLSRKQITCVFFAWWSVSGHSHHGIKVYGMERRYDAFSSQKLWSGLMNLFKHVSTTCCYVLFMKFFS